MDPCPCGTQLTYDECCRPLIAGEKAALTAEHLMRSRYSAYVKRELDYILTSLHPDHRSDYDEKSSRAWAENTEWHSFEILGTSAGGPGDERGEVEFVASYSEKGVKQRHHERSTFEKLDGLWYFVGGEMVPPRPVVRAAPKTGRNDPCSCGSGLKFKKCCGR